MEREYKFKIGDVVVPMVFVSVTIGNSVINISKDELLVCYRYFDGNRNIYVVRFQEDVCVAISEDDLAYVRHEVGESQQQVSPMGSDTQDKDCISYVLGYVYRVNNRLVAALSIEKAIEVFYRYPSHEYDTIRKIEQIDVDCALIQKG